MAPLNMGSSPPSSNEATHFGTPSTNITAMSPEAYNAANTPRISTTNGIRASRNVRNLALQELSLARFSPMANDFTPQTADFNPDTTVARVSPVQNLVVGSMPDNRGTVQQTAHGAVGQAAGPGVVEELNLHVALSSVPNVVSGVFSTDENVTRTFQIYDQNIPSLYHILHQFPVRFESLACVDSRHIERGIIRLSFNDDRDAKQAYALAATLTHAHCEITQLTAKDVAIAHGQDPGTVTNYEGQLLVSVVYDPQSNSPTLAQFIQNLSVHGDLKAVALVSRIAPRSIAFRIEYNDVLQAAEAARHLPEASHGSIEYLVAPYQPDVYRRAPGSAPSIAQRNAVQPSLTGRSTLPNSDIARLENVMARVMREPSTHHRGAARIGHNVVDIGRIEAGLDVRTTIMLRNIPNRVTQSDLKRLMDMSSFGHFDFMYLRIDFANNLNVGYAFINFVDPLAIIPFARARAGKRWNMFSSDKVAEISYATIQGRDCLIQKFRNSSVMLEHPTFRPKLYYTHPSSQVGAEESFPDPDNYSKMRRSIDNAETVGLYRLNNNNNQGNRNRRVVTAPANIRRIAFPNTSNSRRIQMPDTPVSPTASALLSWPSSTTSSSFDTGLFAPREGQAHREEQRRRRSQFDRGTPGAEIELLSYRLTDAALDDPRADTGTTSRAASMPFNGGNMNGARAAFRNTRNF